MIHCYSPLILWKLNCWQYLLNICLVFQSSEFNFFFWFVILGKVVDNNWYWKRQHKHSTNCTKTAGKLQTKTLVRLLHCPRQRKVREMSYSCCYVLCWTYLAQQGVGGEVPVPDWGQSLHRPPAHCNRINGRFHSGQRLRSPEIQSFQRRPATSVSDSKVQRWAIKLTEELQYNAPHSLRNGLEAGVGLPVLEVVGQAAEHQHSHQHQREQQPDVLHNNVRLS